MLYNVPRAATVSAKNNKDCTLYRVDRRTFRYFIDSQHPRGIDGLNTELKKIDNVIDKIDHSSTPSQPEVVMASMVGDCSPACVSELFVPD